MEKSVLANWVRGVLLFLIGLALLQTIQLAGLRKQSMEVRKSMELLGLEQAEILCEVGILLDKGEQQRC